MFEYIAKLFGIETQSARRAKIRADAEKAKAGAEQTMRHARLFAEINAPKRATSSAPSADNNNDIANPLNPLSPFYFGAHHAAEPTPDRWVPSPSPAHSPHHASPPASTSYECPVPSHHTPTHHSPPPCYEPPSYSPPLSYDSSPSPSYDSGSSPSPSFDSGSGGGW